VLRTVVALLAGVSVAASGLIGLIRGDLVGLLLVIAAVAAALVTYATSAFKKKVCDVRYLRGWHLSVT
jgi:hypothetical protein